MLFIHYLFIYVSISSLIISSKTLSLNGPPSISLKSATAYKRLASQCYIDDYSAWLARQQELLMWLNLVKLLKLPIQDSDVIKQELEQIRLQHECLRVIERLPVSVGPG